VAQHKSISHQSVEGSKFKRLFFDIETSYNIVKAWRAGYNLNINHDDIIKERAVICICYKWAGESKVHYLHWKDGCDKQMLKDFIKIMNSADQVIGHNGDAYDLPWIRTRCIYHGISMFPEYSTLDTLKLAKAGFNFNSNKLDYIAKFLGLGGKVETGGLKLWDQVVLEGDKQALKKMIEYCQHDVTLLEKVYDKLANYTKHKMHVGVLLGQSKCSCPECGSSELHSRGKLITAAGTVKRRLHCQDCGRYFSMTESVYLKSLKK
jgi:DNA polymerase elongation subunit (family B)